MTKPRGRREELRVGAVIECDLGEIAAGVIEVGGHRFARRHSHGGLN